MAKRLRRSESALLLVGLAMGGVLLLVAALHPHLYFVVDWPQYPVLHTALELSSILISFSVLVVNWESSKQTHNARSLFVGTGFLVVACVDTMHTLSFQGMPDFVTPNGASKAIYYWLFARLWAAGLLWAAAYVRPQASSRYLCHHFLLAVNLLACLIPFAVITLFGAELPAMFVAGYGPTWVMLLVEFVAIGIYLAAMRAHLRLYQISGDHSTLLVVAALGASVLSEMALTLYMSAEDVYFLLGHIYKVIAYYLIYRALTVSSVHRPYAQLKVAKDRLERTVAALNARNRELDALDEVAVALGASLKPDEVLETAIERVMRVMGAGAGAIFLLEEGSDRLGLVAWRGLAPAVVDECSGQAIRVAQAASERAGSGRGLAAESTFPVNGLGSTLPRVSPLGTCVCSPIASKGRFLGTIVMIASTDRYYTLRDADLLTAIGYQFGLAIENARLYEQRDERLREKMHELQRAERRARFLSEAGALLSANTDLGKMLGLVARRAVEVLGDWCLIYLLDHRQRALVLKAAYHPHERELRSVLAVLSSRPIPVGKGLVGHVANTGESVLEVDVGSEEIAVEFQQLGLSVEERLALRGMRPNSRVAAPLRVRGRAEGVLLLLATHSGQQLAESDLSLAVELAGRIGAAIENRQLFQESQAQRRHLEAIISQMVDGVVVTDSSGRSIVVNSSAQKMLAGGLERLLLEPRQVPEQPSRGGAWTAARSIVARAISGELVTGEEIRGAGAAGKAVLSASASPVRDEAGSVTGAVVVLRDVTAEREVERMKDEFVATITHELRTPLTAVLGYTDILLRGLRGPLEKRQKDALESVRSAAMRLLGLINDLLDTSRLEAGRQELVLELVDLSEAVERALTGVSVQAASKGIRLQRSLARDIPLVLADDELLQRILANLLYNAIKFTPEGGTVTVSARQHDERSDPRVGGGPQTGQEAGFLAVTVSDTGVGIPPEHQERIWDKFQQVDSSSRRLFGGTGLGLAITKALVELHGGRVWVHSEGVPGKGSTFGFTLKVAPSGRRARTRQPEDQGPTAKPGKTHGHP